MNDWDKYCGIADRIKGILFTYNLAKKFNRNFFISWTQPFLLTKYLEPADVEWSIDSDNITFHTSYSMPLIIMRRSGHRIQKKIGKYVLKSLFKNKKELHVSTNYNLPESLIPTLFSELFRPSLLLRDKLAEYEEFHPYYSFAFRFMQLLGDFEDNYGEILNVEAREKLIESCLKELSIVLQELPKGYKALVTSDSKTFLKRASKIDSRIFYIDGEIIHPYTSIRNSIQTPDIYLKTFIDFFMIKNAERIYLFKTGKMYASGFPKLAAQIGKKPYITYEF